MRIVASRGRTSCALVPLALLLSSAALGEEPDLVEQCVNCASAALAPALVRLSSPDPSERVVAIAALALLDRDDARAALLLAARDREAAVRAAALGALAQHAVPSLLGRFIAADRDVDAPVRLAALAALGRLAEPAGRAHLVAVLKDATRAPSERLAALASLERHGTLEARAEISRLALTLDVRPDDPVASAVAAAVARPPPCSSCREPARTTMLARLYSARPEERLAASQALAAADLPPEAKVQLLARLVDDSEPSVRAAAIDGLSALATEPLALIALVQVACTDDEENARERAIAQLARVPSQLLLPVLAPALRDSRPEVAIRALVLLARRPDAAVTTALLELIPEAGTDAARAALILLGRRTLDDATRIAVLRATLTHSAPAIVASAIATLNVMNAAALLPELAAAVARDDLPVQDVAAAVRVVASLSGDQARALLTAAAEHPDPSVRGVALAALSKRPGAAPPPSQLVTDIDGLKVALRAGAALTPRQLLVLLEADAGAQVLAVVREAGAATPPGWLPVLEAGLRAADAEVAGGFLSLYTSAPRPTPQARLDIVAQSIELAKSVATATALYRFLVANNAADLDDVQRRLVASARAPLSMRRHALAAVLDRRPTDRQALAGRLVADSDAGMRQTATVLLSASDSATLLAAFSPTAAPALESDAGPSADSLPALPRPLNGRWPLIVSMAGLGSLAFGTVANVAMLTPGGKGASYALGAFVGGATPFLFLLNADITVGQAGYVTSHTAWAAAGSLELATMVRLGDTLHQPGANRGVSLLSGMVLAGVTSLTAKRADWSGRDLWLANLSALEIGALGGGAAMLLRSGSPYARADNGADSAAKGNLRLAVASAWALGLWPYTLLQDHLSVGPDQARFIASSTLLGGLLGGFAGLSRRSTLDDRAALAWGVLAGQGLGFVSGLGLSQELSLVAGQPVRLGASTLLGAAAGGGLATALQLSAGRRGPLGLAVDAGALVGLGASLAIPDLMSPVSGRRGLAAFGAVYGGFAGALAPRLDRAYEATPAGGETTRSAPRARRHWGGLLAGASLGYLGGAMLEQRYAPTDRELVTGAGFAALLGLSGLGGGLLSCRYTHPDAHCPAAWRSSAAVESMGALGVLGAASWTPALPTSSAAVSNGLALGIWGAWNGTLLARLDSKFDATASAGAALTLGAVAGGAAYVAMGRRELSGGVGWGVLAGSLLGNGWGYSLGWLIPETTTTTRTGLSLAFGASGAVAAFWRPTRSELTSSDTLLAAAWGAGHAAMLPRFWSPDAPQRDRRTGAGLAFGGLSGAVFGLAASPLLGPRQLTEAVLISTLGDSVGAGLSLFAAPRQRSAVYRNASLGGLGGLALGLVAAPWTSYEPTDAYLLSAALGLGGLYGRLAASGRDSTAAAGGGLAGGAALTLAAAAFAQIAAPRDPADVGEVVLTSAATLGAGLGLGWSAWPNETRRPGFAALAGGLAGSLGATVWAPYTRFDRAAAPALLLGTVVGGASGAFLPRAWREDATPSFSAVRGGLLLGTSVGLLTGGALAQRYVLEPGAAVELAVAYSAGSLLGYGSGGLAQPGSQRLRTWTQLGGGALGLGAATQWLPYTTYSATDVGLGALGIAIGAWHGQLQQSVSPAVEGQDPASAPPRLRFVGFAGAGLGAFAAMGLAQLVEYEVGDLVDIAVANVAGNFMGAGLGMMLTAAGPNTRVTAQHLGGLGLAGAALWVAPRLHLQPSDAPTLMLTTGLGASLGAWLPATFLPDVPSRARRGGAMLGSSTGLVLGALAAQFFDLESSLALTVTGGAAAGAALGDGVRALYFGRYSRPVGARVGLGTSVGGAALLGGFASVLRLETFDTGSAGFGGLLGAEVGTWVFGLHAAPGDEGRRWFAGLEVGVPLGVLGAGLAAPRLRLTSGDLGIGALAMLAGQVSGASLAYLVGDAHGLAMRTAATAWSAEVGGLTALGLALATSPRANFVDSDALYVAMTVTAGAVYGGMLGNAWARPQRSSLEQTEASALAGGALGALAGGAATQALHLDTGDTMEVILATMTGHLFVDGAATLLEPGVGHPVAASVGGLGGLVAGSLFAPTSRFDANGKWLVALATALGGWSGSRLVALEDQASAPRVSTWDGARTGGAFGLATGLVLGRYLELSSDTVAFAGLGAVSGNALGWGFGQLWPLADRAHATAVGMSVGGVGLAVGLGWVGDELRLDRSNAAMVGLLTGAGAWHGAWFSRARQRELDSPGRQSAGGAMLGAGAGLLSGSLLASHLTYHGADVTESLLGWTAANSFGAGLGLVLSHDDRWAVGLMEGSGIVGGLAFAALAPRTEFTGEDWLLGVLAASQGAWQGVGTTRLFNQTSARSMAGGVLLTTSVGGVLGAAFGQRLSLSTADVWAGFSGTLWGSWLGAWVGFVYQDRLGLDVAGVSVLGSDVGLLLSSLAVSRVGNMPPARVGWINAFGVGGALAGAGVGTLLKTKMNVQKGNVFGTAAGLLAGTVLTGVFDLGTRDESSTPTGAKAAQIEPTSWRLPTWLPSVDIAMPMVGPVMPMTPQSWVAPDAMQVGVSGIWH